jgi:hypothetical protein
MLSRLNLPKRRTDRRTQRQSLAPRVRTVAAPRSVSGGGQGKGYGRQRPRSRRAVGLW